jgi:hypothetical protein
MPNLVSPGSPNFPDAPNILPDQCAAIVFSIAGYSCALPMQIVSKIVRLTQPIDGQQQTACLVIDDVPTTVLNLYPRFTHIAGKEQNQLCQPKHISDIAIMVRTAHSPCSAVLVDASPTLMMLSLKSTHPLPLSYRQAVGAIAQQVVIQPDHPTRPMIFLLDLDQIH